MSDNVGSMCDDKKPYLEDSLGPLVEDIFIELRVVHREADAREEIEDPLVLFVTQNASEVCEGS